MLSETFKNLSQPIKIILILSFAILIALIIWLVWPKKTILDLTSNPDKATIFIGNKTYQTPLKLRVAAGTISISAFKDGYLSYSQEVEIKKGKTNTVKINMIRTSNKVDILSEEGLRGVFSQIPFNNTHFKIDWDENRNLVITPNVDCGQMGTSIRSCIKDNWSQYENYGKEALKWLNDNKMDQKTLDTYKIKISWWFEEFWPANANISL